MYAPYADEMFAAMEWGIRPGEWFFLPRWERAAMAAAVLARGLIEAAVAESMEK